MKIFNTLSAIKEEFRPIKNKKVGVFVCGPTVYDYSHIGHARTYVIFDVIVKYLRYRGYDVNFVMNITDIDDKIIRRAKEENKSPKAVAEFYEKAFMEDIEALGIDSVNLFARATEHIPEIINQIQVLLDKGYAYIVENEGVYFDISKFDGYGKLAKRTVEQAEDAVSRIDESVNKRNKGDFALWKFCSLPCWDSPWGQGRPGWHIEDTAISEKYLGPQFEIHCGGQDLIFPHHEAEIAQAQAATGKKPHVKYWLHSGFITVDGKKMSKSLKNFIFIRDLLKNYSPQALRFMVLSTHYRSPIDYKEKLIKQAEAGVMRIRELMDKLEFIKKNSELRIENSKLKLKNLIEETKEKFEEKMDDDFNTPQALAVIFDFIREVNGLLNKNKLGEKSAQAILKFIKELNKILGIVSEKSLELPREVRKLIEEREKLRKERNWDQADKLRKEINSMGWTIDDTSFGPMVKKNPA